MADPRLSSVTIQRDSDATGRVAIYYQDPETGARGTKIAGDLKDRQAAEAWLQMNGRTKGDSARNE